MQYLFIWFLAFFVYHVSSSTCSVIFYLDAGWGGSSFTLFPTPPNNARLNLANYPGFNDAISGIKFVTGTDNLACWVRACWNSYCAGWQYGNSNDYTESFSYVGNFANDVISYVNVLSYDPINDVYVRLYKSCPGTQDYEWFVFIESYTQSKEANDPAPYETDFFTTDLEQNNIGNDQLSALHVPENVVIILYTDDQLEGPSLTLSAGDYCLTNVNGQNFNDIVSSFSVYDLTNGKAFPTVLGYWKQTASVGSVDTITYTGSVTYTSSSTTTKSSSVTTTITSSIESTIEFEGEGSITAKVESSLASQYSDSIETALSASTTSTCVMTCGNYLTENCPPGGQIYLWVWQIELAGLQANDPSFTVFTCDYICSCSATPPACPALACLDTHCTTCSNWQS